MLSEKTFLHYKYLTKSLNDEFIFYKNFQFEIKSLPIIKDILKESDKLFSNVYKQSQCMIFRYFQTADIKRFFIGIF